jgi:hypothetical protein
LVNSMEHKDVRRLEPVQGNHQHRCHRRREYNSQLASVPEGDGRP